jgi:putative FmdB family regulatory protein
MQELERAMPIYEYECRQCGHTFDELQKISDAQLTDCPACGESSLRKLISAPNFRLKGEGWYETDFKKDNRKNLAGDHGDTGSSNGSAKDKADSADSGSGGKDKKAKSGESTGESKPKGKTSKGTGDSGKVT